MRAPTSFLPFSHEVTSTDMTLLDLSFENRLPNPALLLKGIFETVEARFETPVGFFSSHNFYMSFSTGRFYPISPGSQTQHVTTTREFLILHNQARFTLNLIISLFCLSYRADKNLFDLLPSPGAMPGGVCCF
jgi:hypothetical protein